MVLATLPQKDRGGGQHAAHTLALSIPATEQRGDNLKRMKDSRLKAQARIWLCMCHIRSTADQLIPFQLQRRKDAVFQRRNAGVSVCCIYIDTGLSRPLILEFSDRDVYDPYPHHLSLTNLCSSRQMTTTFALPQVTHCAITVQQFN